MPMPQDYEWPAATHFTFYEHTGAFTQAWHEAGVECVTWVADRRCTRAPPPGCYHFIVTVQEFVNAHPQPIHSNTTHS
eukprot:6342599-Prymnesium_polylepis.1